VARKHAQQVKLAKLLAITPPLSDKQARRLAVLQKQLALLATPPVRAESEPVSAPEVAATRTPAMPNRKARRLADERVQPPPGLLPKPAPPARAHPTAAPPPAAKRSRFSDSSTGAAPSKAAKTGADCTVVCAECAVAFIFSADEQEVFAEAGWYKPSRCSACSFAKKERFDAKAAKLAARPAAPTVPSRCFNCGSGGHVAADCPKPRAAVDAPKACYHCGSTAHLSRACNRAVKSSHAADKPCFHCGQQGHERAQCPAPPPTPICFNCGGEVGSDEHPLRNCVLSKRTSGVCYAFKHGRCDRKNCKFEH